MTDQTNPLILGVSPRGTVQIDSMQIRMTSRSLPVLTIGRRPLLLLVLSALSCLLPIGYAAADLADDINAIRSRGCEGRAGIHESLRKTRAFDEIAREWSRGGRLGEAIQRTEHRLANSSSMHVQGTKDERTLLKVIAENYCDIVLDATFTHIGVHRDGNEAWIVVGTPLAYPSPGTSAEVSARALELVNAARAQARQCGNTAFDAAPPLTLSPVLERAALAHAKDMAAHSAFEHIGSDGSRPADRVRRAGYRWRAVGENIAAGTADIETVVQGWLDSPGHCANLMGKQYEEMGIAFHIEPKSKQAIYWAQVFATKR